MGPMTDAQFENFAYKFDVCFNYIVYSSTSVLAIASIVMQWRI